MVWYNFEGPSVLGDPSYNFCSDQSGQPESPNYCNDANGPRFSFGVLPVRECKFPFPFAFECSCYWLQIQDSLNGGGPYFFGGCGIVCRRNNVTPPTFLCMLSHVARRLHIPFIQEPLDTPRSMFAHYSRAMEHMRMAAKVVTHRGIESEEGIDRRCPVLAEPFYKSNFRK